MPQAEVKSTRHSIQVLSSHLANQIAAGEVVDRPASIVKELLENSLDSGATRIQVALTQGGMQSITVQDDGNGIPENELSLALAPHATSKIRQVEDLVSISSMGFRGEALASIASVSRLQITSRAGETDNAFSLSGRHGESNEETIPAAHPPGTTVRVEELFFNTPVRRRFLRSERTEFRHCEDVVRRIALSHFDIAFHFLHNQRTIFNLPQAGDVNLHEQRLKSLCGESFIKQSVHLSFNTRGLALQGWVGLPAASRPQTDLQYFFVNGRIIRDRLVSHAIRQAYADSIFPGRHPAYVLYLTVPLDEVDVNVHPTKHEVRFHQGRMVHDFLSRCVRDAIEQQTHLNPLPYAKEKLDWHQPAVDTVSTPAKQDTHISRVQTSRKNLAQIAELHSSYTQPVYATSPAPTDIVLLQRISSQFALFQYQDDIGVVDILKLAQSVWGRELSDESVVSQPVLFPVTIDLESEIHDWIDQHLDWFPQVGLDIQLAENSLKIYQRPSSFNRIDVQRLLEIFLQRVVSQPIDQHEDLINTLLDCAVLQIENLNHDDVETMLRQAINQSDTSCWQLPFIRQLNDEVVKRVFESTRP